MTSADPPGPREPGQLQPLSPQLDHRVHAFADALRRIFLSLDMTLGQYAIRHRRNKADVSRWLSGNRVPERAMVDEMLAEATRRLHHPVTDEVRYHIHKLHAAAILAQGPLTQRIQLLSDEMDGALTELQQVKAERKDLQDALGHRNQQVHDLTIRSRQLEQAWASERVRTQGEMDDADAEIRELHAQRNRLESEIKTLKSRLRRAHENEAILTERCRQLERELEEHDNQSAPSTPASPLTQPDVSHPRRAPGPYFFLSHAGTQAADPAEAKKANRWVMKLFKDICDNVLEYTNITDFSKVGYLSFSDWTESTSHALETCRIFVPLYSPRLFDSERCGKEWAAFEARLHAISDAENRPPALLPALWTPAPHADSLPKVARAIQFSHSRLGVIYHDQGFYGLTKTPSRRAQYQRASLEFAKRIVEIAENEPSVPIGVPLDYEALPNAFRRELSG
uniref:TIR-like protein FxsC n=1 Tax=Herbidospora sakaeratensis TaxID=564415 RepID=UPI0012FA44CF|nr:TIR-like protein FxsC [Herbidospora sakaeratensis]